MNATIVIATIILLATIIIGSGYLFKDGIFSSSVPVANTGGMYTASRNQGANCQVHTDCPGWGTGVTDMACCQGQCMAKVADWAGIGFCPHECAGSAGAPGGTC